MLTQRLFLSFSELQTSPRRRRRGREREFRDAVGRRRAPRHQVPADVEGGLHVLRVLRLCADEGGGTES